MYNIFFLFPVLIINLSSLAIFGSNAVRPAFKLGRAQMMDMDLLETRNRDGILPRFPLEPDLRKLTSNIVKSHEVLRKALQQYIDLKDMDLGKYLNHLIFQRTGPFVDEYGQTIHAYQRVFRFIWEQYNETLVYNYAIHQFDKDKLDLCSVARFLSHQRSVESHKTIMKTMGDSLEYRCHPCTPYKRKEYGPTIVPSTNDIGPEGVTPDESLILCKESSKPNTTSIIPLLNETSESTTEPAVHNYSSLNSSNVSNAQEILRNGLQQFLGFEDADLSIYLNHLIFKRTEPFLDEYDQVIAAYRRVFRFIWEQYNETRIGNNFTVLQSNKIRLDMCSVARYLSHQPAVKNRNTIMKRIGDSLGYRCHPCTPYKRKEYGLIIVPNTDNISPDGVSPELSLILCKQLETPDQSNNHTEITTESAIEFSTPNIPSFDFRPCEYHKGAIVCDRVPIEEVQIIFLKTSPLLVDLIQLVLRPISDRFIPADIFGNKKTNALQIKFFGVPCDCDGVKKDSLNLKVAPNAFRFTQNLTSKLILGTLDCSELDFSFISGFTKLTNLTLLDVGNIQLCLQRIAELPRTLTHLEISYPTGMNEILNLPMLTKGLTVAKFAGFPERDPTRKWDIETMEKILDWVLLSSANTLESLSFTRMNLMTEVPSQIIRSFADLCRVWLTKNNITTIKTGAFSFKVPVCVLDLVNNGITQIEPGSFQGDFMSTQFFISENRLTTFEESVFGSMLQQMSKGKGFIKATQNPIDCSDDKICNLAWLRRFKADEKFFLNCSNGTSFKDLSLSVFSNCPAA